MKMQKTAPAPANIAADRKSLGMRLRMLRKSEGLTLQQLSARTGVALSTLSKMELGQVSISYEKFTAVARALGVDIAQLFGPAVRPAESQDIRAVHNTLKASPGYHTGSYDYKLLSAEYPDRHMTPIYGRILARTQDDFDDYVRHPGQEFLMVLSGELEIKFETGNSLILKQQDTAYFDSGIGHIYLSRSNSPAEILVVMTDAAPGVD